MITVSQVDRCRLDIGHFELETVGTILTGSMRINLFDANVTGHLTTTDGSVSFTTMTMSSEHLFVIDIETEGKESGLDLRYVPEHGICNGRYLPDDYVKNPLPECSTVYSRRTYQVCQHRLLVEGDYAEAYTIDRQKQQIQLYATIDNSIPATHLRDISAKTNSVRMLERILDRGMSVLLKEHYDFWHSYYTHSFLSIPDMKWEGFYWIQVMLC